MTQDLPSRGCLLAQQLPHPQEVFRSVDACSGMRSNFQDCDGVAVFERSQLLEHFKAFEYTSAEHRKALQKFDSVGIQTNVVQGRVVARKCAWFGVKALAIPGDGGARKIKRAVALIAHHFDNVRVKEASQVSEWAGTGGNRSLGVLR